MSYQVRLTNQAIDLIQEAVSYISEELLAPETAQMWLKRLQAQMATLSELPACIPLTPEKPWRDAGVRRMVFENFFVYFWIDDPNAIVWIIAVLYSRRDQRQGLIDTQL